MAYTLPRGAMNPNAAAQHAQNIKNSLAKKAKAAAQQKALAAKKKAAAAKSVPAK